MTRNLKSKYTYLSFATLKRLYFENVGGLFLQAANFKIKKILIK